MTPPKFTCQNCGDCCGPVPVTDGEWRKILRAIRGKSPHEIKRMQEQKREPVSVGGIVTATCIFRDEENNNCFIYEVRPL